MRLDPITLKVISFKCRSNKFSSTKRNPKHETLHHTDDVVVLIPDLVDMLSEHVSKPVTLDDHSKVEPPLFHSEQDCETPSRR